MNAADSVRTAPALSVILPAFNEERRLENGLRQVVDCLSGFGRPFEVLVVDDGSRDRTDRIAEQWARSVPSIRLLRLRENRGKGAAVRTGVAASEGDWLLVTDVDLSTPIQELAVLQEASGRADVVVGSRVAVGARLGKRQPGRRERLGRWFNAAARLTAVPGILDTQCGFKLWRREAARAVFPRLRLNRFAFDVECLWLAKRLGYRVREVPVRWSHEGHSTVHVFRDGSRMLWDLLGLLLRRVLGS